MYNYTLYIYIYQFIYKTNNSTSSTPVPSAPGRPSAGWHRRGRRRVCPGAQDQRRS